MAFQILHIAASSPSRFDLPLCRTI